ncbi:MAG: hypothetical protein ACI4E2_06480 [Acetatifactor sp.]
MVLHTFGRNLKWNPHIHYDKLYIVSTYLNCTSHYSSFFIIIIHNHCYFTSFVLTTTADLNTNISSCRPGTYFCDISTFNQFRQGSFYSYFAYIRT